MSKLPLPALTDQRRQQRWAAQIYLLDFTFYRDKYGPAPTSMPLHASDRSYANLIGERWQPLVKDWGAAGDALQAIDPEGVVGSFDVTFYNNVPIVTDDGLSVARFSDLIRHAANTTGYDVTGSEAILRVVFTDLAVSTPAMTATVFDPTVFDTTVFDAQTPGAPPAAIALFRLGIEEPLDITEETITLRMSGIEGALEDLDDLYRINTTDFPFSDPADVGKPVPVVLGSVSNLQALGAVAGLSDKLATVNLDGTPQVVTPSTPGVGQFLAVSSPTVWTRIQAGFPTGTVQIDQELINYDLIDVPNLRVRVSQRGANSTTSAAHGVGATIQQALTTHVYLIAENRGNHRHQAVDAGRLAGALLVAGGATGYTISLNDTSQVAGRSFVSATFTSPPTLVQSNPVLSDTIAVLDSIAVQDALGVGDNIAFTTPSSETLSMQTALALPAILSTSASGPDRSGTMDITYPNLPAGGAVQQVIYRVTIVWQTGVIFATGPFNYRLTFGGNTWNLGGGRGDPVAGWQDSGSIQIQVQLNGYGTQTLTWVMFGYNGACTVQVTAASAEVRRDLPLNKSGAASRSGGVTKGGAAVKGGTVTLTGSNPFTIAGAVTFDVRGLLDDNAGTITSVLGAQAGTPNAALTLPTDHTLLLMREFWKEKTPANFNTAVWLATRQAQAAAGFVWGFAFTGLAFSEFRREVGRQGRADLYQESALWVYNWRLSTFTTPVMTLTDKEFESAAGGAYSPRFSLTPPTSVATRLRVLYDQSTWPGEFTPGALVAGWRKGLDLSAPTAVLNRFGARTGRDQRDAPQKLQLTFVRDNATATALGNFWLGVWQDQHVQADMTVPWSAIILDKDDPIAIQAMVLQTEQSPLPLAFLVRKKTYRIADGFIELQAVEAGIFPLLDALVVALTEALATISVTMKPSDPVVVLLNESIGTFVTFAPLTDTTALALSEALAITSVTFKSVSDTVAVALTDTAVIIVLTQKSVSDSAAVALSEAVTQLKTFWDLNFVWDTSTWDT